MTDTLIQYIGTESIFNEQIIATNHIDSILSKKENSPLLIAQPQQGKTGVMLGYIERFKRRMEDQGKSYEILYIICQSDNDLRSQTKQRLYGAKLVFDDNINISRINGVVLLHHGNLEGYNPSNVDERLVIIDECHIALQETSEDNNRPLYNCLVTKLGIKYGFPMSQWKNKNINVISVSATPYSQVIVEKIRDRTFEKVTLEKSNDYYSFQKLRNSGRIQQSKPIIRNKELTSFWHQKFLDFEVFCNRDGYGYLLLRTSKKEVEPEKLIREFIEINRRAGKDLAVFEFSKRKGNIRELDSQLSKEPSCPTVIIIKGALRSGKTLTDTQYIRMWIDTPKSKSDSTAQSVGRNLGYPSKTTGHSKEKDTFPIYCDLKMIDDAIKFYDEDCEFVPIGGHNTRPRKKVKYIAREINPFEYLKHNFTDLNEIDEHSINRSKLKEDFGDEFIHWCKTNRKFSVAGVVLGNVAHGKRHRVLIMNGPNKDHVGDWDKYIEVYPDGLHKWFVIDRIEEETITTEDNLSRQNMMKEEVV